jgi:acyl-CoA thioester hydrolase
MKNIEYKTELRVIYADTDAMAVVYHSNYFKWFEVGRSELLRNIGYPYNRLEQEGVMLPVVECGCKYIKPALYDDLLEITAIIKEVKAATVIIEYEIRRKSSEERLVTGFTRHAVTDSSLKPVRLQRVAPELYRLFLNKKQDAKDN